MLPTDYAQFISQRLPASSKTGDLPLTNWGGTFGYRPFARDTCEAPATWLAPASCSWSAVFSRSSWRILSCSFASFVWVSVNRYSIWRRIPDQPRWRLMSLQYCSSRSHSFVPVAFPSFFARRQNFTKCPFFSHRWQSAFTITFPFLSERSCMVYHSCRRLKYLALSTFRQLK